MPTAEKPEQEAVVRTFLIADLRGYTAFTLEHGDAAAARLASRFAALTREAVAVYDGEVVELRGDEALAVFTSSRRALRAALELQARLAAAVASDPPLSLQVGIGLDAGEAIPLEGGYRGSALNLAARLCSLAGPGEILISDAVTHLAGKVEGLSYVARGATQFKGFAELVHVFHLQWESQHSLPSTAATIGSVPAPVQSLPIGGFAGSLAAGPLVARSAELERAGEAIDAVEHGNGRLLMLVGEPGVGKTRLIQEITLRLRDRHFLLVAGSCYQGREASPYSPFFALVAALYDLAPPPLRIQVPQTFPYLGKLLPHQSLPIPPTGDGREEQELLFWSVTGFVRAMAQTAPVALLLDDLHWSDSSSLALLQHVARHTRGNRVLILATYRDVEVGRWHPLEGALRDLNRQGLVDRLVVRRLSEVATAELIQVITDQTVANPELAEILYQRTEGNPFFVHQVVRELLERGLLEQNGRLSRTALDLLEVPESIRSVVGQRFSRLSEAAQAVLLEASVLGQRFRFDDLLGTGKREEQELEASLEEAGKAGLVLTTDGEEYAFDHALTHQSLYAELSPRRRRKLHLAAGAAIEALPERQRSGRTAELARHYLEGHDAQKALIYTTMAGVEADQLSAYRDAEVHLRTAVELAGELEDPRTEVETLERLGKVLYTIGRYEEAEEITERVADLYHTLEDLEGEATAVAYLSYAHSARTHGSPLQEHLERRVSDMIGHIEPRGPSLALGRLYQAACWYPLLRGNPHESSALIRRAVDVGRVVNDRVFLADALLDTYAVEQNMAAVPFLHEAIAMAEADKNSALLAWAGRLLGEFYYLRDLADLPNARHCLERVVELFERVGGWDMAAHVHAELARVLYLGGDWVGARLRLERALELLPQIGNNWGAPSTFGMLARLDIEEGNWSEAEDALLRLEELAGERDNVAHLRDFLLLRSQLDMLRGDPEGALRRLASLRTKQPAEPGQPSSQLEEVLVLLELGRYEEARATATEHRTLAQERGQRLPQIEALVTAAIASCRSLPRDDAKPLFEEALAMVRHAGFPQHEGRLLYEHGRALGSRKDLEEAVMIFERLGARPYLDRARDALADLSPP